MKALAARATRYSKKLNAKKGDRLDCPRFARIEDEL